MRNLYMNLIHLQVFGVCIYNSSCRHVPLSMTLDVKPACNQPERAVAHRHLLATSYRFSETPSASTTRFISC